MHSAISKTSGGDALQQLLNTRVHAPEGWWLLPLFSMFLKAPPLSLQWAQPLTAQSRQCSPFFWTLWITPQICFLIFQPLPRAGSHKWKDHFRIPSLPQNPFTKNLWYLTLHFLWIYRIFAEKSGACQKGVKVLKPSNQIHILDLTERWPFGTN